RHDRNNGQAGGTYGWRPARPQNSAWLARRHTGRLKRALSRGLNMNHRGTEGWFCHHLLAGRWYGAAGRFQAQLYKNREVVGWESTFVAVIQRLMGKNLHP